MSWNDVCFGVPRSHHAGARQQIQICSRPASLPIVGYGCQQNFSCRQAKCRQLGADTYIALIWRSCLSVSSTTQDRTVTVAQVVGRALARILVLGFSSRRFIHVYPFVALIFSKIGNHNDGSNKRKARDTLGCLCLSPFPTLCHFHTLGHRCFLSLRLPSVDGPSQNVSNTSAVREQNVRVFYTFPFPGLLTRRFSCLLRALWRCVSSPPCCEQFYRM